MDEAVAVLVADWPAAHLAIVDEVDRTLAAVAPGLRPPERAGAMLGYGPFHYRYASGREGDAHLIALRSAAKALKVYIAATDGDAYVAEARAAELGRVSVGRSCITVRRAGDLDLAVFGEVVARAVTLGGAGSVPGPS